MRFWVIVGDFLGIILTVLKLEILKIVKFTIHDFRRNYSI